MEPRRRVSFFLDGDLETALQALKGSTGIPQAEAIRRAIREYLKRQGALKTERKQAATRKRP